jgi:hypothetical protein
MYLVDSGMKYTKQQNPISELKKVFYKIFKNTNPFGSMFNDVIKQKFILCPTDGYYLNENQFNALMKTSKASGETSFYLYEIENCLLDNPEEKNTYSFGYGELSNKISYEEYKNLKIVLENALYSTDGSWGVIISHEDHGVIGGNNDFIESFKEFYPSLNQDYKNFIKMWEENKTQYNSNLNWLPDFLKYINT